MTVFSSDMLKDIDDVGVLSHAEQKTSFKAWNPGVNQVRLVPYPALSDLRNPNSEMRPTAATELKVHYAKDLNDKVLEVFVCPKSYGESCASCDHGWTVYNARKELGKLKEDDKLWKRFLPSDAYVYYGFDRAREQEFIKAGLIQLEPIKFSKQIHEALEALKNDPSVGKFMSITNGMDIKVTYSAAAALNRQQSLSIKETHPRSALLSSEYLSDQTTTDKKGNIVIAPQDHEMINELLVAAWGNISPISSLYSILKEDAILDVMERMNSNDRLVTEVQFGTSPSNKLDAVMGASVEFDDDDVPF